MGTPSTSTKSVKDFSAAWLPRFSDAPYYLTTFLPQGVMDVMAPLEVSPRPDTVIRVLMDYRPLRELLPFAAAVMPPPPARRGFTVVEWGGIRR